MHHWGRYAVVAALSLAALPAMNAGGAWSVAGYVWILLMGGLYWEWVVKD